MVDPGSNTWDILPKEKRFLAGRRSGEKIHAKKITRYQQIWPISRLYQKLACISFKKLFSQREIYNTQMMSVCIHIYGSKKIFSVKKTGVDHSFIICYEKPASQANGLNLSRFIWSLLTAKLCYVLWSNWFRKKTRWHCWLYWLLPYVCKACKKIKANLKQFH